MIRAELPWLIFLYVAACIGAISLCWAWHASVRKYREIRLRRYRLQCTICGTSYEDRTTESLPVCPQCRHPNERNRPKAY